MRSLEGEPTHRINQHQQINRKNSEFDESKPEDKDTNPKKILLTDPKEVRKEM